MNALEQLNEAIDKYVKAMRANADVYLATAAGDREISAQLRILFRMDKSLMDLLDARDQLFDGDQIDASLFHGHAVLKALGLTPKERRALWMFFALGRSRRRSLSEIAAELRMSERKLGSYIQAIQMKVPDVRFRFSGYIDPD